MLVSFYILKYHSWIFYLTGKKLLLLFIYLIHFDEKKIFIKLGFEIITGNKLEIKFKYN